MPISLTTTPRNSPPSDTLLRKKAVELEGQFLAEMLRHAGASKPLESFGGGIGEDQMASFMREAQGQAIAKKGGIGLADALFKAMKGREHVKP